MFSVFYKPVVNLTSFVISLLRLAFMSNYFEQELNRLNRFSANGLAEHGRGFRSCLLFSGSTEWCYRQTITSLSVLVAGNNKLPSSNTKVTQKNIFWLGESIDNSSLDQLSRQYPQSSRVQWDKNHSALCADIQYINTSQAKKLLGVDTSYVVVDTRYGLSPDILGMLVGSLKGGATLLLLTPPFDSWVDYDDPDHRRYRALRPMSYAMNAGFIRRFIRQLKEQISHNTEGFLSIINESDTSKNADFPLAIYQADSDIIRQPDSVEADNITATPEQANIIRQVVQLADLPKGIIFLTADRGRGKSVALGLAIKQLINDSNYGAQTQDNYKPPKIFVTAALRSNVENLFAAINQSDNETSAANYIAVDQLIIDAEKNIQQVAIKNNKNGDAVQPLCDLLIVDEAAALPLPVLNRLLEICPRLIFSSTLHGYEGSGRGFALRFKQALLNKYAEVNCLSLQQPLRWAANDPMEHFFNRVLLLDCADADQGDSCKIDNSSPVSLIYRKVTSEELFANESLLRSVFGLLIDAHYQTRPSDLRQLLDVPYIHLWIAEAQGQEDTNDSVQSEVLAVLLVCEEGGFDDNAICDPAEDVEALLSGIVSGKRRPQGNLLAQALANHAADSQWCRSNALRVMRIAVIADSRRCGLASQLLQTMERFAGQNNIAYWGSSFGYEPSLLEFWQQQGAVAVHLGVHLDKASGMRNIMVVKPLNDTLSNMTTSLANKLIADLPYWQKTYFKTLIELPVVRPMQVNQADSSAQLERDRLSLKRFLNDEISYDRVYPALCRLFTRQQIDISAFAVTSASLELAPDWTALASSTGIKGRRQLIATIKAELIQLSFT